MRVERKSQRQRRYGPGGQGDRTLCDAERGCQGSDLGGDEDDDRRTPGHITLNVLARMNEHGDDRVVGPSYKVVQGKTYHMKIERHGATITAWADDHELAKLTDANPLTGPGHDHFAFNDWQSELWFDNLRIEAL